MSEFKVLVLCQRKEGKERLGERNVNNTTVPLINLLLDHFFPEKNYSVEYMSRRDLNYAPGDIVDYEFALSEEFPEAVEFVESHLKHYSLVLLNTCPYMLMNYEMIKKILTDDGRMVFSAFPTADLLSRIDELIRMAANKSLAPKESNNFMNYFVRNEETGPAEVPSVVVFNKKIDGGKKSKKGRKISRRLKKKYKYTKNALSRKTTRKTRTNK
jgi:hypothetical protein